jgi:hypothetical protein
MPWKFLFVVGIVKKNIYGRIRNWIRNFLLVREDPDPKLGRKWDPNPDPKKKFRMHNTGCNILSTQRQSQN